MTQLLSFHGDPKVKAKYLRRVKAHAKADEIVKGQYWEDGRGCAVGCTIHSGEHDAYETELGLPKWLALLEDAIFENLPNGHAKEFPAKFLAAIPVGTNLEPVKWRFCTYLLGENYERVKTLAISEELKAQVLAAIDQCRKVHEAAIESGTWDESAAGSAESAAESAESAAWSAAVSAAWSAAVSAARSAARSAAPAAAHGGAGVRRDYLPARNAAVRPRQVRHGHPQQGLPPCRSSLATGLLQAGSMQSAWAGFQ